MSMFEGHVSTSRQGGLDAAARKLAYAEADAVPVVKDDAVEYDKRTFRIRDDHTDAFDAGEPGRLAETEWGFWEWVPLDKLKRLKAELRHKLREVEDLSRSIEDLK